VVATAIWQGKLRLGRASTFSGYSNKVARLPSKDREEVMKVLRSSKVLKLIKQKIRNCRRQRERVTKSLLEFHNSS